MKKIFAAAALLLAMTACGGSQKEALPLEGTTWKLAKMDYHRMDRRAGYTAHPLWRRGMNDI